MCAVIKISPCMLDESRAFHFEEPSTTGGTSGHPLDELHPQPQRPPTEEKRKEKKKKERREGRVGRRLVGCSIATAVGPRKWINMSYVIAGDRAV